MKKITDDDLDDLVATLDGLKNVRKHIISNHVTEHRNNKPRITERLFIEVLRGYGITMDPA